MKTYSEERQVILFKAARDLRKVACRALNDCTEPAEFRGATYGWAREYAKGIMEQAARLENDGHEMAVATQLQETLLSKSRDEYSHAVTRHIRLHDEYTSVR